MRDCELIDQLEKVITQLDFLDTAMGGVLTENVSDRFACGFSHTLNQIQKGLVEISKQLQIKTAIR